MRVIGSSRYVGILPVTRTIRGYWCPKCLQIWPAAENEQHDQLALGHDDRGHHYGDEYTKPSISGWCKESPIPLVEV